MARVKGAMMTRKRRNKTLKLAKSYWGSKSRHFKMAKQAVYKSGVYAYVGRKLKKRPYFCGGRSVRHQLFPLHERPEEGWHRDEPQGHLRAGYRRSRRVRGPRRGRQEGALIPEQQRAQPDGCARFLWLSLRI